MHAAGLQQGRQQLAQHLPLSSSKQRNMPVLPPPPVPLPAHHGTLASTRTRQLRPRGPWRFGIADRLSKQ